MRWRVLALLLAMIALGHFNRISMSVAGSEQILKQHADTITETQMGWVYSAYLIVYAIAMTPGGWLIDRCGPRRALMLLGFGSAGFVILTGLVGLACSAAGLLLAGLLVVRACLGVVSAPLHPAGARSVSFWFPPGAWAGINGMVTASACIGIASTYFVFGELMDARRLARRLYGHGRRHSRCWRWPGRRTSPISPRSIRRQPSRTGPHRSRTTRRTPPLPTPPQAPGTSCGIAAWSS